MLPQWKSEISKGSFKYDVAYILFVAISIIVFLPKFLLFIESRNGVVLNDPVLDILPPKDFSIPLFSLIYLSILFTLIYNLNKPEVFMKLLQTWGTLQLVRMLTIYLVPLDTPAGFVPLIDPLVDGFIGTGECVVTKDLFFSGHTSTSFLAILFLDKKALKIGATIVCFLIALLVLWQHVHYTIDVIAAPFFSLAVFWLVSRKNQIFRKAWLA